MRCSGRGCVARLAVVALVAIGGPSALAAQEGQSQSDALRFLAMSSGPDRVPAPVDVSRVALLRRRVTLTLDDTPLKTVLAAVGRLAGVTFAFSPEALDGQRRIRVRADRLTLAAVLTEILLDAGVDVLLSGGNRVILVPRHAEAKAPVETGSVAGRVVDAKTGSGLESVEFVLGGTKWRALSGSDGRYRLADVAVGNYTLTARRIGYQHRRQDVAVSASADITADFALEPSAISLDDVVVTGTAGGSQRRAIGNSVTQIKASDFEDIAASQNLSQLLNARVPGMGVVAGSGLVGSGPKITTRGPGSFRLRSEPLLYVDGVRVENSFAPTAGFAWSVLTRLNDINPEEIESIEVIKGPAAATLYGTEASVGVIQIITKKGAVGKARVGVTAESGVNWFMHPEERWFTNYARDPVSGQVMSLNVIQNETARGTPVFRNGFVRKYGVDVSGGSPTLQYYVSGTYQQPNGIEPTNYQKMTSGRANLTIQPSARFDANVSLGVWANDVHLGPENPSVWVDGQFGSPLTATAAQRGFATTPPEIVHKIEGSRQRTFRSTNSLQLRHRPAAWLTHSLTAGADITIEDGTNLVPRLSSAEAALLPALQQAGTKTLSSRNIYRTTVDYVAGVTAHLTPSLTSTTSAGLQFSRTLTNTKTASGQSFAVPGSGLETVDATTLNKTGGETFEDNRTVGTFVQEQLGWHNRLFLTGAVRADDNSAFGNKFDAVLYPKLSAAWVVSEEPFWPLPWVNILKLRFAYGQAGRQPTSFAAIRTYMGIEGPGGSVAVTPSQPGNSALGPERSEEYEGGVEAALFGDRITLEVTHFRRVTRDALWNVTEAPSGGNAGNTPFSTKPLNLGRLQSRGVEGRLTVVPITSRRLDWEVSGNVSTAYTKVLGLNLEGVSLVSNVTLRQQPGYPVNAYFARRIVSADRAANGTAINVLCDGGPGAAPVACASAPQVFMGPSAPTVFGAASSTVSLFKTIRLYALVDFKSGYRQEDWSSNERCRARKLCEDNLFPERFDPVFVAGNQVPELGYDRYYPSGAFAKLREVSLTVTPSARWAARVGAKALSLTIAARNLHTWTDFVGLDPEASALAFGGSFARNEVPQLASFLATLRVTF